MDERIVGILERIETLEMARIASGALGFQVTDAGPLTYSEISTPHAEGRTVAIIKVEGDAGGRKWSSVVKVLDMALPPTARFAGFTHPETEEIVYEEGYFVDARGLRPARCYAISRPLEAIKLLWLEDLTAAAGAPFSLAQLGEMAQHFGAWNGENAQRPPTFKFPLLRNAYAHRFAGWGFETKLTQMQEYWEHPAVRAMYRDHPLSILVEFCEAMAALARWGQQQPGSLAFGDCSAGNLFYRAGETIGIDWASLTLDPTGVDAGCLIGSSITWGRDFLVVAQNERDLFRSYLQGLRASGFKGDDNAVRLGYFCLFGFYVAATMGLSTSVVGADTFLARSYLEKRYGMPMEEIPAAAAPIVDMAPAFTSEIKALLG